MYRMNLCSHFRKMSQTSCSQFNCTTVLLVTLRIGMCLTWFVETNCCAIAKLRVQGEHKKVVPSPWLCWYSAVRATCVQIFTWNITQLFNKKIPVYTLLRSLVEIYWNMTKVCYFNQDNPTFLSIPSIVFTSSLLVALKRTSLLVMR